MLRSCLIVILSIGAAVCLPQVTFTKDGQVGVNFGGYHAEAGLGGPSGLSASAGTPNGQNAQAGLGGDGAFAEANAGGGIGASATLSGDTNGPKAEGEANAQTNTKVYTKKVVYSSVNTNSGSQDVVKQKEYTATPQQENYFGYQKFVEFPTYTKHVRYQPVGYYRKIHRVRPVFRKEIITGPIQPEPVVEQVAHEESPTRVYNKEIHVTANGSKYKQGLFDAIFQIPIATLQAVNDLVKQATSGGATYTKTIRPVAETVASEESSTRVYNKEIHVTANGNKYKKGLFDSIFQIPIVTLQAVNNLVNQATSGGATYTKTISVN